MTFFNQFHKEATERKMRKIAESQKSPMSPKEFVDYMNHNVELANQMCHEANETTMAAVSEAINRKEYPSNQLYNNADELFQALDKE